MIRFVVYDSDPGVCEETNTRTNVMFQNSLLTNERKMWRQHSLSYVRMTIVQIGLNTNVYKFANFTGLYFPYLTTFCNQTLQFF